MTGFNRFDCPSLDLGISSQLLEQGTSNTLLTHMPVVSEIRVLIGLIHCTHVRLDRVDSLHSIPFNLRFIPTAYCLHLRSIYGPYHLFARWLSYRCGPFNDLLCGLYMFWISERCQCGIGELVKTMPDICHVSTRLFTSMKVLGMYFLFLLHD